MQKMALMASRSYALTFTSFSYARFVVCIVFRAKTSFVTHTQLVVLHSLFSRILLVAQANYHPSLTTI